MTSPLVTIICACYNQEAFILESLNSIKKQTFQDFEIIIWDDASIDNSVKIIDQWIIEHPEYKITFLKNERNLGICKSLNNCYKLSRGKYIQLIALDDTMLPWKLEKHVDLLEQSSEKDALVFSDAYLMDAHSIRYQNMFIAWHHNYLSLQSGNFFDSLLNYNYIPTMSVLYKKSALEVVGLWDEDLVFEDYDMLLRLADRFDFIFDDKPSVIYRLHQQNTFKVLRKAIQTSTFKLYLKHVKVDKVKQKLFYIIEEKYLRGTLEGEEKLYFDLFPPNSILEKVMQLKFHSIIYKILKKFSSK